MTQFEKFSTEIDGLFIVQPFCVEDERGYYIKSYEKDILQSLGMDIGVQEICGSYSKAGVIRGLHLQTENAQSKLVRCAYGEIFDVAVDMRKDSATFGKWYGITLTHINNKMLFVPSGFAHGIMAISDEAILSYHSAEKYSSKFDKGIIWNDPDLNISWPINKIKRQPILSEKDRTLPTFREFCDVWNTGRER